MSKKKQEHRESDKPGRVKGKNHGQTGGKKTRSPVPSTHENKAASGKQVNSPR